MAAEIVIEDVPGANGRYPLDMTYFTARELHILKVETGIRPNEMEAAIEAGDTDIVIGLALIALRRAGKTVPSSVIWDSVIGKIRLDVTEDEPEEAAEPLPPPSEPAGSESESGNRTFSTPVSSDGLDRSEPDPKAIGLPG